MTNSSKKIEWIELLRIVSIFAIVILHVASKGVFDNLKINTAGWIWLNAFHSLTKFGVCCFIMISGALFLNLDKKITIRDIFQKYIKRIVMIFLTWSSVYTVFSMAVKVLIRKQQFSISDILSNFLNGYVHLWFLYMIVGLYLLTPILRKIVEDKQITEYFIVLCGIFFFLPNMLCIFPNVQIFVENILRNKMYFYFGMGYIAYYVIGNYLYKYEISNKVRNSIYVLGICSSIYTVAVSTWYSRKVGEVSVAPYLNTTLNIAIISSAVFLLFKYQIGKSEFLHKHSKKICCLGSCTLGIYVIHVALVEIFSTKVIYLFNYRFLYLTVPILSMIIFIISLCITLVIKKIKLIGNKIV